MIDDHRGPPPADILVGSESAEIKRLRDALTKISSPTQSTDLLWWQIEARAALASASTVNNPATLEKSDFQKFDVEGEQLRNEQETSKQHVMGSREVRLYDGSAPIADDYDVPMTAAEQVLAWLLIEKIGAPDDVSYSPDQAQDIIVSSLDQAAKQLVDGGEMLLKAEAIITELTALVAAAKEVVACASDTYRKRNGHLGSFEDDSGEKCWIVPFDAFEGLRSATAGVAASAEVEG